MRYPVLGRGIFLLQFKNKYCKLKACCFYFGVSKRAMKSKKEAEVLVKDEDHLEEYPERRQVSAFPERRFIKTNRMLAIFALINLAMVIAGVCLFISTVPRVDVEITGPSNAFLYQMNSEDKILRPSGYLFSTASADRFIMESFLKQFITERHSTRNNLDDTLNQFTDKALVLRASSPRLRSKMRSDLEDIQRETVYQNKVRDVHIYNIHPYHENLWTAVIETFDFPMPGDVCTCNDNSEECLNCKIQKNIGRQRRRIWIRAVFTKPGMKNWNGWVRKIKNEQKDEFLETSIDNPFGIQILGYYVGYMPLSPVSSLWDLPRELKNRL